MTLSELRQKLQLLESQRINLDNEIIQTKREIEKLSPFSKDQKVELFKSLFIGRSDVFAKYWISKDGLKKGYSPSTYTFKGNDYIPISNQIIQQHLEGKIRLGTYVVVNQTMAKFLVIDLDKASFIEDSRAIKKISLSLGLKPLIELSKSGNGIHIWYFFELPIRAKDARKLGDIIITKAMDTSSGIDMTSYDRMFPNQDFVAPDALGNLVALPLHYGSRCENKTVFIDINTMQPFQNQWEILQNISKISFYQVSAILKEHLLNSNYDENLMPWEIKQEKPLVFPKITKAILYDALYIEKQNLSKEVLNKLQRLSSFSNPEFFVLQNLRKSTFNTPRIITSFDINERYIIVPRGLTQKIINLFNSNKAKLFIEDKRFTRSIDKLDFTLTLKDEQKIALQKILVQDYSILIASPGFGKTAIAAAVVEKRKVNTLILVNKSNLLEQWVERLCEYFKIDVKAIGKLGNGKKKLNSNLDIATLQSLKNKPEIIEEYSQIIIDEVHHIPAVSFEIPLKKFKGKYALGLSATPARQDGMQPIMFMQCGEIAYESKKEIRKIHILKTVVSPFEALIDDFGLILNEMVEDFDRNNLIISEIEKLKDRNILVLSERIEHLNILYHLLDAKGLKSTLVHGGLKSKMKKEFLKEANSSSIILSTNSFIGEGIDFSHLDAIILTMPVSYWGRIVQYLGRIGRDGQECIAVDFFDKNTPMLRSSFHKRQRGYKNMGYVPINEKSLF